VVGNASVLEISARENLKTQRSAEKKEGSCTIPARKLYDYIKLLPDAEITIKLLENHWTSAEGAEKSF